MYLVAEGYNNKEIAEKMYLSEGTIRNYLSLLLEKLNLRDRTQLAIYYYKDLVEWTINDETKTPKSGVFLICHYKKRNFPVAVVIETALAVPITGNFET